MKSTDLERQVDAIVKDHTRGVPEIRDIVKHAILCGVDLGIARSQEIINTAREREIELNYQEQKERLNSQNPEHVEAEKTSGIQ